MIIKIRQGEFDTNTMSLEELINLNSTIQDAVINMNSQMEETKLRVITSREYADPSWFRSLNFALRTYRKHSQALLQLISIRRKQENMRLSEKESAEFRDVFFMVCREKLLPELMESLIQETNRRTGQI